MRGPSAIPGVNLLLAALTADEFDTLRAGFEPVDLAYGQVIHKPGDTTTHVHFPTAGVLSMLTTLNNGWSIQLATVGNEGMVDISVVLGTARSESRVIVQVPGQALRMQAGTFRDHLDRLPRLREVLGAYTFELFTMTAQNTACHGAHTIRQRVARWLLMTHDRVTADDFPITHEFLAELTGAARPTVTDTLASIENHRAIQRRRGSVKILDRAALEADACECYRLISDRLQSLARGQQDARGR